MVKVEVVYDLRVLRHFGPKNSHKKYLSNLQRFFNYTRFSHKIITPNHIFWHVSIQPFYWILCYRHLFFAYIFFKGFAMFKFIGANHFTCNNPIEKKF